MTRHDDSTDDSIDLSRRDFTKALGAASIASVGAGASSTAAAAPTTQVGSGGYTTTIPSRPTAPPDPAYATENVTAPYPTNDWWSRLLTTTHSETLFSHPIFTEPTGSGLEIGYTDEWDVGTGNGVDLADTTDADGNDLAPNTGMSDTAYMPFEPDFTIGHTATSSFDQSLVDGYGDWHVEYRLGSADPSMTVTQVQGSPYLYLDYRGGGTELSFDAAPTVFKDGGNALGVTIDGHHYGLFAPSGTTWSGTGTATLSNDLGTAGYVTIALLPDDSTSTFDTFAQYAHHRVTDTQIDWEFVETEGGEVVSEVRTTFDFTVEDLTGSGGTGTLTALYPHQHKYLADGESTVSGMSYESPRGTMRVTTGASFTTVLTYPGILPSVPIVESAQGEAIGGYADAASLPSPSTNDNYDGSLAEKHGIPTASEVNITWGTALAFKDGKEAPFGGTYWTGLNYNRWSETAALLDAGGWSGRRDCVLDVMKGSLEQWFTPEGDLDAGPDELDSNHFFYDDTWGTMVGEVGGFGSYKELNDHHFHYGYFVKGASEVARQDPTWAETGNWGGMVRHLIREYANPVRDDDMFPFLRNFSPYAGRSFASGVNPFHLGNNQEASSEAINAYAGLIRWGAFTGQEIGGTAIENLGIFLYTHEIHAALEYWYDWDQENHPDDWDRDYASVVWGDGYSHSTWWTEDNEDAYAINVVPANGDSLYLGWDEDHTQTVYDELVSLKGDEDFTKWKGVLLEFGAFADASNSLSIFNDWEAGNFPGGESYYAPDMHSTKFHTFATLNALEALGSPTESVVSDTTFSHVFVDESGQKNYVVYNPEDAATTVTFSDGCTFEVAADTLAVQNGITGIDDPTAPTTPSGLSVDSVSDTTVTLSWAESGVGNYRIYRDGSEYTTASGTSVTVTGLASATEHSFTVAAVNGVGTESAESESISVATEANSEDYSISVSEPSPGEVRVAFTPTAAADSAALTYSVDGGSESTAAMSDEDGDGTWTATLTGRSQNEEIAHSVTFDRAGNSYETMTVTYTVVGSDTNPPTVPSNLTASNATPRTVDLSWDAATDAETEVVEYTVYEGSSELTTATGTSTTVADLSPGTTYEFSVSATDLAGKESAKSARVGITTPEDPLAGLDDQEWDQVWADEFDDASLDTATWGYDVGGGCGPSGSFDTSCSWGNQESQYYTDGDNARIENGSLVLEAREEEAPNGINPYTSARVLSSGKKTAQYGRVDVRATLPQGQGIWPALWMLGDNIGEVGWPNCGEIDIMELVGNDPDTVHGTVHGPGYSGGDAIGGSYSLDSATFAEGPHTFSIVWDPDQIKWFVDGTQYHTVTRSEVESAGNEWVFDDSEFFFIFNVAVGGEWPGYPDDTTTFPQQMRVHHIRQYKAVEGDTSAPTSPSNLATADATQTTVDLSWDAATDDVGVDHYVVTVDGEQFTTTSTTSVTVDGLTADTNYEFGVRAVDAAGNASATATVTGATIPEASGPVLSIEFPDGNSVRADGTIDGQVTLSQAADGLAGFDVTVSLADTAVATITDASVASAFPSNLQSVSIAADGSDVTLEATDANDQIESGATDVALGTITFTPQSAGETDVATAIDQIDADGGSLIEPTVEGGRLTVTQVLDAIGDNPAPTDPDGDGLYEDINGNGRIDANDVVVLFNHREDSAITDQIEYFDFNGNGRDVLDFDDINELFEEY